MNATRVSKGRAKILPDDLLGQIWAKTICKDYLQTTLACKRLKLHYKEQYTGISESKKSL